MQHSLRASVESLGALTARPLAAGSLAEFLSGIRAGTESLHALLTAPTEKTRAANIATFEAAVMALRNAPRQRKALELCAWPLFDKPALPSAPGDQDHFLWLFTVPVLVQLPLPCPDLIILPGDALRTDLVIEALEKSDCLNPAAVVSGLTSLFSREDLQALGPAGLAQTFVHAEQSEYPVLPEPLPLILDPDIESSRVVVLYVLLAARLPVGQRYLFEPNATWPSAKLEELVCSALDAEGLAIEKVTCLPGCSMSETQYRCAGPAIHEISRWISLGKEHYGLASVYAHIPAPGIAELVGVTEKGEELLLAPSFSFVEPVAALSAACRELCDSAGLPFTGAYASVLQTSEALH